MKKKFDVCVYTLDWETIESFNTLEEAIEFAKKEFNKHHYDLAIFHGDLLVTEYKP